MYPVPVHEFRRRLRKWETEAAREKIHTRSGTLPALEYWSEGRCRLRVVYHRDGAALYADRGVPRYQQRPADVGKIAFTDFGDAGV